MALDIVGDVHFWRRQQLGVNLAALYCTFWYWIQYFWYNIPAIAVLISPEEGRAEESIWILQWGPEMLMWAVRIYITIPYLLCSSGIIPLTRQRQEKLSLRWGILTVASSYLKYLVSYSFQAENQRNVEHNYSSNLFTTRASS